MLAIFAVVAVAQFQHPKHPPKWFDYLLAGYAFAYDQNHSATAVLDPNTHYMLMRTVECDGADMTLLLTRDRPEVDSFGIGIPGYSKNIEDKEIKAVVKPLPSLSTGKGVAIGFSPEQVLSKLGTPGKKESTGGRKQFLNYEYSYQVGHGMQATLYQETYVFKENKLIEVLFTWGPGEGYEDMALVAPKAKKAVKNKH